MARKVGFLGTCETPYCGGVSGYFCVRCHRYVSDCRCSPAHCGCADSRGWASTGERAAVRTSLMFPAGMNPLPPVKRSIPADMSRAAPAKPPTPVPGLNPTERGNGPGDLPEERSDA